MNIIFCQYFNNLLFVLSGLRCDDVQTALQILNTHYKLCKTCFLFLPHGLCRYCFHPWDLAGWVGRNNNLVRVASEKPQGVEVYMWQGHWLSVGMQHHGETLN